MKWFVGALLMGLFVLGSGDAGAKEPARPSPPCLTRARKQLPGETMASFVKGGHVGSKRLLFRRGDVVLVIDYPVLEETLRAFLKQKGAEKFPEEGRLLQRFSQALRNRDEVDADPLVQSKLEQERLDLRLAEVFDEGAFEIRDARGASKKAGATPRAAPDLILRLDYAYECGERCGTGGRIFLTDACQQLVAVTDWVH
jgi:hypothetical protein